jgi:hypothetical protein
MDATTILSAEVARYQAMSVQLRNDYCEIDEETLADTLEGLSTLPELLHGIIRSSLDDEALASALRTRLTDMRTRLERLEVRYQRKRQLVCEAMGRANIEKLNTEDFSVSRRNGVSRLEIMNEADIPAAYLLFQAPRPDRQKLLAALKRGEQVPGIRLQDGEAHIQVRTR